jgi:hypothetical protein
VSGANGKSWVERDAAVVWSAAVLFEHPRPMGEWDVLENVRSRAGQLALLLAERVGGRPVVHEVRRADCRRQFRFHRRNREWLHDATDWRWSVVVLPGGEADLAGLLVG